MESQKSEDDVLGGGGGGGGERAGQWVGKMLRTRDFLEGRIPWHLQGVAQKGLDFPRQTLLETFGEI